MVLVHVNILAVDTIWKFNLAKISEVTNKKILLFKAFHLEFKEKLKEVTDHMSFIFSGVSCGKLCSYILKHIQFSVNVDISLFGHCKKCCSRLISV